MATKEIVDDVKINNGPNQLARCDNTGKLPSSVIPSGGGGAVDSVNGFTGVVVLTADDIDDSADLNKWASQLQLDQIATNTGDIGTLQTDVTNLQDDTTINNGPLQLTRTDPTGKLPLAVLPSEVHKWDYPLQNILNGAFTNLTGGSAVINQGLGTFDINGIFTCGITGEYMISTSIVYVANATGYRWCWYLVNGGAVSETQSPTTLANVTGGVSTYVVYSFAINLNAGDTLQIQPTQSSGAGLDAFVRVRISQIQ